MRSAGIIIWSQARGTFGQWALGASFTAAVVIALIEMFRTDSGRPERLVGGFAVTTVFVVIAAALLVGYVFVEIFPTRLAVMAQTFRMVALAAWLGWILIAAQIAGLLDRRAWRWAALSAASAVSVPTLLVYRQPRSSPPL